MQIIHIDLAILDLEGCASKIREKIEESKIEFQVFHRITDTDACILTEHQLSRHDVDKMTDSDLIQHLKYFQPCQHGICSDIWIKEQEHAQRWVNEIGYAQEHIARQYDEWEKEMLLAKKASEPTKNQKKRARKKKK